ncbi:MAG: Slp family lipoprotein [Proteobacteria bacterium]|nr:Slp family lipoprotein [Pseudomonadota bacterium]
MYSRIVLCLTILVLSGCASQVPILIKLPPDPNPEFHQVINNIDTFQNQYVRWGGKIISVENKENSTWIEILASPLNRYGRPSSNTDYEGRFIAKVDGFLDPEHYSKDRNLTIFGTIDTEFVKRIDDHPYSYPLVSTKVYYLWPEYRTARYQYRYRYSYYHGYYYPYYRYHFGFHHHSHHFGFHHYY